MRGSAGLLVTMSAVSVLGAACTREPVPPEPIANEDVVAPADRAPAESSLAIKRGIMTLAEERSTFKPCDGSAELWVLDQSPGLTTQVLMEDAESAPLELYVEAYGERAPAADDPEARSYEGIFVLEEVLYAGVPAEVRGCEAPAASYIVAARGNEPFWSIEVAEKQIVWRQPEAPTQTVFGSPQTQNAEGAVRYRASAAGQELELRVHMQACTDSMSGEFFAYTAKAILNDKEFSGCARVGR